MRFIALYLPAIAVWATSVGCRERLKADVAGAVLFALPEWPERGRSNDPAVGYVERADGKGSRVLIAWDIDPRPGPATAAEARGATGLEKADIGMPAQVAGHAAVSLRSALVWRCDRTNRLLRLVAEGPRAPDPAALAAKMNCHPAGAAAGGDVPPAAAAALGAEWRFAHRGKASASYTRDDAVLTLFAGQQLPPPRDPEAAQKAAPAWVAAAGLADAKAETAEIAQGPQGHKALKVKGTAKLDGRPVRWTMVFWRCIQRQRSFTAVFFSRIDEPSEALLSPRCHG